MKVVTLSRWNEKDDIFGSICAFDTLRVGFPTADIEIFHSGHIRILDEVTKVKGAVTSYIHHDFRHDEWIKQVIDENNGELVIVDTDMIFYQNVEVMLSIYPALIAGRFIPPYYNEVVKADEVSRIHTSFMYIKSVARLKHHLAEVTSLQKPNFPFDPYAPFQLMLENKPVFYDTCANMFHMIPDNLKHKFDDAMLNTYTHLYCGTMLNFVASRINNSDRLKKHHFMAKENSNSVRGLWKEQQQYYQNCTLRN